MIRRIFTRKSAIAVVTAGEGGGKRVGEQEDQQEHEVEIRNDDQ